MIHMMGSCLIYFTFFLYEAEHITAYSMSSYHKTNSGSVYCWLRLLSSDMQDATPQL